MTPSETAYITNCARKIDDNHLQAVILYRGYSVADFFTLGPDASKRALAKVKQATPPNRDNPALPIYRAEWTRRVRAKCGI